MFPSSGKYPVSDCAVDNPVPVIVVVFDELPLTSLLAEDLSIDRQQFPAFARLADTSTWFPNAARTAPTGVVAVRDRPSASPTRVQLRPPRGDSCTSPSSETA